MLHQVWQLHQAMTAPDPKKTSVITSFFNHTSFSNEKNI
jgi:hypothetical protein